MARAEMDSTTEKGVMGWVRVLVCVRACVCMSVCVFVCVCVLVFVCVRGCEGGWVSQCWWVVCIGEVSFGVC